MSETVIVTHLLTVIFLLAFVAKFIPTIKSCKTPRWAMQPKYDQVLQHLNCKQIFVWMRNKHTKNKKSEETPEETFGKKEQTKDESLENKKPRKEQSPNSSANDNHREAQSILISETATGHLLWWL